VCICVHLWFQSVVVRLWFQQAVAVHPRCPPRMLPADARILIVRFTSLGDVVKATALPRLIRRRYPQARITFLTAEANVELVRDNPHVERAIGFPRRSGLPGLLRLARELRAQRFHLVADVHRSLRSRLLTALLGAPRTLYGKRTLQRLALIHFRWNTYARAWGKEQDFLAALRPFGVEDDGAGSELFVGGLEANPALRARFAGELGRIEAWRAAGRPVLGLTAVARWPLKVWPLAHARTLLERYVAATDGGVVLFGGPGDDGAAALARGLESHVLSLVGRTSHLESAFFAQRCDLMLSNDTGMSHIAEAVGRDAVVLFGPTSRELGYFPVRPGSRVLERDLPCRPCSRNGAGRCTHPWPMACLAGITPDAALAAVLEKLGRSGPAWPAR
jgi:ADP-heptose:LPS heptosyltransferase